MISKSEKGNVKMVAFSFRLKENELEALKERSDQVPAGLIVRALVKKWLDGEVDLDLFKDKPKGKTGK